MKLLDRYLIGQFTKNLLQVLCGLLAIYLLVDFFERVDNFLEAGKSMGLAIQYLLLKIPLIYEQLLPVCILLAGVITLGVLNHHHELMALSASGICLARIVRPLLVAAGLFTLLTLLASQWLLPPTLAVTNRIWYQEVKHQLPRGIIRYGRTYYRDEEGIFSFVRPDPKANRFTSFSFTAWDQGYRLRTLLTADQAWWQEGQWHFANGQLEKRQADGSSRVRLFKELTLPLTTRPTDFFMPPYKAEERSLSELIRAARDDTDRSGQATLLLHKRLSYIFLGFPLLLLGIPVLLVMHRGRGRDLALAIPVSCGLAFAAWGGWSALQSMAAAGYLPPMVAAWTIHLAGGGLGILFIQQQDR